MKTPKKNGGSISDADLILKDIESETNKVATFARVLLELEAPESRLNLFGFSVREKLC